VIRHGRSMNSKFWTIIRGQLKRPSRSFNNTVDRHHEGTDFELEPASQQRILAISPTHAWQARCLSPKMRQDYERIHARSEPSDHRLTGISERDSRPRRNRIGKKKMASAV